MTDQYDVVVVGAGPSGLSTAIGLARAGVRVLVVEKHPGLSLLPKATGVRPRTVEILRSWGIAQDLIGRAAPVVAGMRVQQVLAAPAREVDLGLPGEAELGPLSPGRIVVAPQDLTEDVLLAHLLARGGEVWFGARVTSLAQGSEGVRLAVRRGEADLELTASYLVGADGSRSFVRSAIGVEVEHLGSEGSQLATLFRADLSAVTPAVPYALTVLEGPGVEGMLVSTGTRDRWIYNIALDARRGETAADWPPERIADRIRAAAGVPDLEVRVVASFPWDFGADVARSLRSGRVFLVGDAAQRTTPRGATGMNTGIAAAHNLGWKLAWVVRGWAGPGLLDSYEAERAPVGRANAERSLVPGGGPHTAHAAGQDFGVVYSSTAIVGGSDLAGRRAPHAWVQFSGGRVSTLDLFDGRFTLLTGPDGEAWRAETDALAAGGVPVAALVAGTDLVDPDGSLAAAYGWEPGGAVLVRPDGYVAWCAAAADLGRLAAVVDQVLGWRPEVLAVAA